MTYFSLKIANKELKWSIKCKSFGLNQSKYFFNYAKEQGISVSKGLGMICYYFACFKSKGRQLIDRFHFKTPIFNLK